MKRTVSALDARLGLDELLQGVHDRGDEVIIERAGKAMAVVIPAERYESMERNRERLFEMIDKVHELNRDVPIEEIEEDVRLAIAEVREQAYGTTSR